MLYLYTGTMDLFSARDRGHSDGWAEVLGRFPSMTGIIPAMRELRHADDASSLVAGLAELEAHLSAQPALVWSLARGPESCEVARRAFVEFPGFLPVGEGKAGLSLCVSAGGRAQLRHDFLEGGCGDVFAHLLLKTRFEDVPEIYTALRWVHGGDSEEVMLRFRHGSVVAGQRIEIRLPHDEAFNLVSIGRHAGADIVFLNGLPVFWRKAETAAPTGVALDVIGAAQGVCALDLPLFMVSYNGMPEYCRGADFGSLFEHLVAECTRGGDIVQLSRCLHAFEGLPHLLSMPAYEAALAANLQRPEGYRDYLADLLVARLPEDGQVAALTALSSFEPAPIVKVENVCVSIDSNPSRHASLSQLFGVRQKKIELLRGINLRAYAGDIVGIIGKNGAGKTTFLKTLVAAMPISAGRISVDGHPILLRPGAGMQGDLTGRENVIKTGLYMGYLPEELRDLMDEIVAFAELEEHIDRPFRYYSDGMRARLIFALATAIPRDILLFDELLSAGDMGFQRRAMKRLDEFIRKAKLVFVVQHTFDFVLSRCTKCLLLDHGRPVYFGDPAIATEIYKESL